MPRVIGIFPLADLSTRTWMLLGPMDWEAPRCTEYSNLVALNALAADHHEKVHWMRAVHRIPPVFLGLLPQRTDLIVPNDEDFLVLTPDGEIVAEQKPPYHDIEKIAALSGNIVPTRDIDGSGVLIGRFGIRTWGHWLAELLPKLVAVEEMAAGQFKYILPDTIESNPNYATLLQSLLVYGIGPERLHLLPPGRYRFTNLYAVSSVWSPVKMHPHAADLMRRRCPVAPAKGYPEKIALLRTESSTRRIENIRSTMLYLNDNGYIPIEIGRLSFQEQVQTFMSAESIVGILGSGLTGLLYATDNIKVVTLAPAQWSDRFFFALMQLRNAALADIRGSQATDDDRNSANARFCIDLRELGNGLAAIHPASAA